MFFSKAIQTNFYDTKKNNETAHYADGRSCHDFLMCFA